ncbi:2-acetyl-1-alkylglycerophosph ocholine esterase [Pyrococcus sp. NA2]|uniref:alpha/beta hydrolase n=1 Tax=Pyrococcus sp. (strain NA2) TaxID=342949 RepID=UPI000209AB3B|nr:2-acetyl-1-alkylglycerophosph ocholine esterase [Pyrococcus sp. NA2]
MKPAIKIIGELGYNILTFDFRAHGESEGSKTTIGDKEILDLMGAIDWLIKNTRTKRIALIGFSMGAMVTIRGLAEDERTCCGVADSPPIYIDRTGARGIKYFAELPESLYPLIKPFIKLFSGAREVNIIEYAEKVRKPLLIIAGSKDPLVTMDEVRDFYERNRDINGGLELWTTDAPHVKSIELYQEEWKNKVEGFLRKHLDSP